MDTNTPTLSYRQFMWGLSNGIGLLAFAGAFWFSMAVLRFGWLVLAPVGIGATTLFVASMRIRRRSAGFRLREVEAESAPANLRARARRIRVGFRWIWLFESALVWAAVGLSLFFQRPDLIWPAMAVAISLHFLPLARLVSVRPYYAMAASGCLLGLVLLVVPEAALSPTLRMALVGVGMGTAIWGTAAYVAVHADSLARMWDDAGGSAQ